MLTNNIGYCYYPTKVILIDDNPNFLREMELALRLKNISALTFQKPDLFLQYMDSYAISTFTTNFLNLIDDGDLEQQTINFDFNKIQERRNDLNRSNEISVIITDYAMPGIDGIALLERLNCKYPIKRILLTGEADEKIAVEVFNKGLIQAFIRKDIRNFVQEVTNKIIALQKKYFFDLSQSMQLLDCFHDPAYLGLVNNIFSEYKVTEYYLLDSCGSFLMIDEKGKPAWFIVRDEKEMQYYLELAEDYEAEEAVAANIIDALRTKSSLLFLDTDGQNLPPSAWGKYLHAAKLLKGNKNYYYAIATR